ncbi:MAG: DNA mismatch repair endonuclease MutL, partial [Cetobacterium sp.]
MGIIKILDESLSNMIAAGEVVENPASLIKELLENSLDADSKYIRIDIKKGGKDIKLTDDGKGMSREDLLLCIERHATSKISSKDDLFNLNTYGFRGEALSSIAAVSKMIISTKRKDDSIGHSINVSGGKITNLKEIQKSSGTEIDIKDLFFNTPARLKFLRKDTTENTKIKEVVLQEAIANPNVSIILSIDGKESLRTSGKGIENTLIELF